MEPKPVPSVSVSSQLDPEACRVLLESSSKPLVLEGQLTSWLDTRSWRATDVCHDLGSTPPTTFKVCPKRDPFSSSNGDVKSTVFETDYDEVEATFDQFKEWLETNKTECQGSSVPEESVESSDVDKGRQPDNFSPQREDAEPSKQDDNEMSKDTAEEPIAKKRKMIRKLTSPCSSDEEGASCKHTNQGSIRDDSPPMLKGLESQDDRAATSQNPLLQYPGNWFWVYADYKYMCNHCEGVDSLQQVVNWGVLGFKDQGWRDSTLWVGSQGAFTPCHYDSYGLNLVAQLSGKKRWTLFSPEDSDKMYPTRVPYEETSIFSEVNLIDPNTEKHPKFKDATPYQVVLKEGDVLMVPKHWWHYVECVGPEPSVSINTWIQQDSDSYDKIKEALLRVLLSPFLCEDTDFMSELVNPNEEVFPSITFNMKFLFIALEKHSMGSCDGKAPAISDFDTPLTETIKMRRLYKDMLRALGNDSILNALTKTLLSKEYT